MSRSRISAFPLHFSSPRPCRPPALTSASQTAVEQWSAASPDQASMNPAVKAQTHVKVRGAAAVGAAKQ